MWVFKRLGIGMVIVGTVVLIVGCGNKQNTERNTTTENIERALPHFLSTIPSRCIRHDLKVSSNGEWARVSLVLSGSPKKCLKYYVNGYWILKRNGDKQWRIVYNGSETPPCSLSVPKDIWETWMVRCSKG